MLTIRAMVRVGPWTVRAVERDENWTSCERCTESIKEIWVCEVDPSYDELLSELGGQLVWRIGSTCGPTLMKVSKDYWKRETKSILKRLRLLKRIEKLIPAAHSAGQTLPALIEERAQLVANDTLDYRLTGHLGLVLTRFERMLGLRR